MAVSVVKNKVGRRIKSEKPNTKAVKVKATVRAMAKQTSSEEIKVAKVITKKRMIGGKESVACSAIKACEGELGIDLAGCGGTYS